MSKFQTGEVVMLNSGGSRMTVSPRTRDDELIEVQWFAGDELARDALHPDCMWLVNGKRDDA